MAQTFNINPGGSQPAPESGAGFKWMVRICGLIAIGGLFLPFLEKMSILELVTNFQEGFANIGVGPTIKGFFQAPTIPGALVKFLFFLPFLLFPLVGLFMFLRGKYKGGPFTMLLLFNIGAFVMFRFFGAEAGIESNFFLLTGIGYWVSTAGLFLPFVGMFFLDKSI